VSYTAASLFLEYLAERGWDVFLEDDLMTVRIGPEVPELSQREILDELEALELDILTVLRGCRVVH
jgi:hypothetical protein